MLYCADQETEQEFSPSGLPRGNRLERGPRLCSSQRVGQLQWVAVSSHKVRPYLASPPRLASKHSHSPSSLMNARRARTTQTLLQLDGPSGLSTLICNMYVQCSKHRTPEHCHKNSLPHCFNKSLNQRRLWLVSRAYLFQIFEEITESRILSEKEIVDFS